MKFKLEVIERIEYNHEFVIEADSFETASYICDLIDEADSLEGVDDIDEIVKNNGGKLLHACLDESGEGELGVYSLDEIEE